MRCAALVVLLLIQREYYCPAQNGFWHVRLQDGHYACGCSVFLKELTAKNNNAFGKNIGWYLAMSAEKSVF